MFIRIVLGEGSELVLHRRDLLKALGWEHDIIVCCHREHNIETALQLAETVIGCGGWKGDLILHDGPVVKGGYLDLPVKPGLGVNLNPDVVNARLVAGEAYWS